jgi:hypothetical protein
MSMIAPELRVGALERRVAVRLRLLDTEVDSERVRLVSACGDEQGRGGMRGGSDCALPVAMCFSRLVMLRGVF